jgi:hypothetical protein
MVKKIAFVLLFFVVFITNSQNISIKGMVTDSLKLPLPYTNIIAKPQNTNLNMSFAITDDDGKYKLLIQSNEIYKITVSYLGYQTQIFEVNSTKDINKNIVLKQNSQQLEEVVVVQQLPVEVKEDTLTYRTKAFVTGKERKLKAVLKQLPGVDVNNDGLVTVQGKKVTHLLVEGKKFFGGGTKLAIENIPANAINEVEVIDNYSEVVLMKGLEETDDMAMNIKLKKDKKKFSFGDVEVGKGNEEYYLAHTGLFYYSPKTRLNFIGDLNNSGSQSFSVSDFYRFEKDIDRVSKTNGSMYNTSANNYSSFVNFEDAIKNNNKFSAININTPITKKTELSGYSIFLHSSTESKNENNTNYFFEENSYIEQLDEENKSDNKLGVVKLNVKYSPKTTNEWYFNSQLKVNNSIGEGTNYAIIDSNENSFKLISEKKEILYSQSVEWYKKISKKQTSVLVLNYKYNKNKPEDNWISNAYLNNETLDEDDYNFFQKVNSTSNQLEIDYKYYKLLGYRSQLQFNIGSLFFNEDYNSNAELETLDNSNYSFSDINFNNSLKYRLNDLFFGLNYKFKYKKLLIESGIYVHKYDWNIIQNNGIKKSKYSLLPNFKAKYSFNKSEKLQFFYELKNSFFNTSQFINNYRLIDYNTVLKGNSSLEYVDYHSARLLYTKFNLYKNIILSGSIGYNKKSKTIKNEVQVVNTDKYLSPVLLNYPDENWNFSGDLYKRYGKFKIRFTGRLDVFNYKQLINENLTAINNYRQTYKSSVQTNFSKAPNVKIGFNLSFNKQSLNTNSYNYSIKEPFCELDYIFLKDFNLKFDYYKNSYKNISDNKTTYELANASLLYQKENSAWSFKFSAKNIFDTTYKLSNSLSDYQSAETKEYVFPRVFMFSLSYKL